MRSLEDLQIIREPSDSKWATTFAISLENPISIHDAVYVAFAGRDRSSDMKQAEKK